MTLRRILAPLLAAALAAGSCRQVTPLPADALRDIQSIGEFREAFNRDVQRPRLLVLLAPT